APCLCVCPSCSFLGAPRAVAVCPRHPGVNAVLLPPDFTTGGTMHGFHPTELTVVFRRQQSRDDASGNITYSGYDIFWPDGRPVRVGLSRFCQIGSRLLVGRRHEGDTAVVKLTLYPVAGLEAPLTRPGGGVRCRRFYAVRNGDQVRLHFLDGTPTEAVFDP